MVWFLSCYTKHQAKRLESLLSFYKQLRLLRALRQYSIVNVQSSIILQQVTNHCKHFFNYFTKRFFNVLLFLLYNEEKNHRSGISKNWQFTNYFWSENCQTILNFLTILILGGLAYWSITKQKKRLKSTIFDLLACFFVFIHSFFDVRIFKLYPYKAKNGDFSVFSTKWKLCFWSTKYKKSHYAKSVPKWKIIFIHKIA